MSRRASLSPLEEALNSRHRPVLTIVGSKSRLDLDFQRFAVYVIKVKIGNFSSRIYRRCSQFYELDSECRKLPNVELPALPKKHFFKSSTDKAVVRGRVSVLQKYLDAVAAQPRLMRSPIMAKWLSASENPGCLSLENPDYEGYLFKQGHVVRNWKQRYFILKEDLLYYLRSKTDMNPLGALSLSGARIEPDSARKHCLKLIPTKASQPLLIAATSEAELHSWKMALQEASSLQVQRRDSPQAAVPKLDLVDLGIDRKSPRRSTSSQVAVDKAALESPSSRLGRTKTDPLEADLSVLLQKNSPSRRDNLLGSVGSIPSMMSDYTNQLKLKRTGSDTAIDSPVAEDKRSVRAASKKNSSNIDEALLETKAAVDVNLEPFLMTVNQALVRSRFSEPAAGSSAPITQSERKSSDRRSQLKTNDSAVYSPRVNVEATNLLETLKDIAVTFRRLTVEELVRDAKCKEMVIGVQALSTKYTLPEQKAFINSLLFILSPFSRLIALQKFTSKRKVPADESKSPSKTDDSMESLLNTGIMRAVAFIGSAFGVSVARTMQYSHGADGKPYSPALTPRRILDGAKRDSEVNVKSVHRRRASKESQQDAPAAATKVQVAKSQEMKPMHSYLVKMQQGRDVTPAADAEAVAGVEVVGPETDEYSMVSFPCETCEEQIQALAMKEHSVYCKIAHDIMRRCGEQDWNSRILALADGVHDRIEELMYEEEQVSIHLVKIEKIARDAAKLGATFMQRDAAEKLLVELRDLLMHGKHVEETALLAFGLPLFNVIRAKYLSVIPVAALEVKRKKEKVTVDSFVKIKPISKGAFGRVDLVCRKGTDSVYARKTLRKSDMIDKNLVDQVITERNILATTKNPYVVQMYYAFQNKHNLFLYMEYLPGGDCASLLENVGYFDPGMAKLYIAETIMAIAYLHSKGVVHRDVKPDNLLITGEGHIKLTDFGLSRLGFFERAPAELGSASEEESTATASRRDAPKGHRVVGTPDYLSPEALLGTGTGASMDWWAVGVTLFEFLTGVPPFNSDTPEKIFQNILNRDIPWPDVPDEMPEDAQDLICKLLTMDPTARLGANGVEEIKQHRFFHDINWETLYMEPRQNTFVPRVADKFDTGYFTPRGPPDLDPGGASDPSDRDSFAGPDENGIDVPDKQREELFAGFSWRYLPEDESKLVPGRVSSPGRPMLLNYRTEQLEAHVRAQQRASNVLSGSSESDEDYGEVVDENSSASIFSQR